MEGIKSKFLTGFVLFIFILITLTYSNTLNSPFNYDDDLYIKIYTTSLGDQYFQPYPPKLRHLSYLTLAINHSVDGLNPFGYHLFNISIHFLTTLVIFFISYITLKKGTEWGRHAAPIAVITTLLFALSPVHTETVTYISGRTTGLSGLFYFSALLMFILGSFSERKTGSQILYYLFSLICFIAAVLSKEPALTLPATILLYDYCFMRSGRWTFFKNRFFFYYLWFLICGAFISFNVMQGVILNWWKNMDFAYALKEATIVGHGFKLLLFPVGLTFDYDFPDAFFPPPITRLWPVILIAFLIPWISNYSTKAAKIFAFCVLWFLITIAPTNSFYPRMDLLSERNLYIPSFGVFFLVASLGYFLFLLQGTRIRKFGFLILTAVLIFHATLLINRNTIYRSNTSIWENTVKNSPGKTRAWQNLSHYYLMESNYVKALETIQGLMRSNPSDKHLSQAYSKLGTTYNRQGNFLKAIAAYEEGIRINPKTPINHLNLGGLYLKQGKFQEAKVAYEHAERLFTKHSQAVPPNLYLNKAFILYNLGSFKQAETAAKIYLSQAPESNYAQNLLGNIYQALGNKMAAEQEFAKKVK